MRLKLFSSKEGAVKRGLIDFIVNYSKLVASQLKLFSLEFFITIESAAICRMSANAEVSCLKRFRVSVNCPASVVNVRSAVILYNCIMLLCVACVVFCWPATLWPGESFWAQITDRRKRRLTAQPRFAFSSPQAWRRKLCPTITTSDSLSQSLKMAAGDRFVYCDVKATWIRRKNHVADRKLGCDLCSSLMQVIHSVPCCPDESLTVVRKTRILTTESLLEGLARWTRSSLVWNRGPHLNMVHFADCSVLWSSFLYLSLLSDMAMFIGWLQSDAIYSLVSFD